MTWDHVMIQNANSALKALESIKLMVVEDDFIIAFDLCDSMERLGANVVGPASSVATALAMIEENPPEVALLDIDLGKEKVWPVADVLVERRIPFVFVSGQVCLKSAVPDRFDAALRICKPADLSALLILVNQSLETGSNYIRSVNASA